MFTKQDAEGVFRKLAADPRIPHASDEYCDERRDLMIAIMLDELAVPAENIGRITYTSRHFKNGWTHHTAPTLTFHDDTGNKITMVLDPSLNPAQMMTSDEFLKALAPYLIKKPAKRDLLHSRLDEYDMAHDGSDYANLELKTDPAKIIAQKTELVDFFAGEAARLAEQGLTGEAYVTEFLRHKNERGKK